VVVVTVVLMAVALGAFAVWFQWGQTRRCLRFLGPEVAGTIQSAPAVEIWDLGSDGERIWRTTSLDASHAPGLVHLRRGLIEDVNYDWDAGDHAGAAVPLRSAAWDVAIVFHGPGPGANPGASAQQTVVLAVDLDPPGSLTVVGRPGRVTLGRLRSGLAKWVEATQKMGIPAGKSGY
jgi:hypothetical protein